MANEVNSVEFGRVLGLLQTIQSQIAEMKSSMNTVVADHSRRLAELETKIAVMSQPRMADKLADKVVWGVLVAAGTIGISAALSYLGGN